MRCSVDMYLCVRDYLCVCVTVYVWLFYQQERILFQQTS